MDIVTVIERFSQISEDEIPEALSNLDEELEGLQTDIVSSCAHGDIEMAWDCLAHYDKCVKLREFVNGMKTAEEVKED